MVKIHQSLVHLHCNNIHSYNLKQYNVNDNFTALILMIAIIIRPTAFPARRRPLGVPAKSACCSAMLKVTQSPPLLGGHDVTINS